MDRIEASIELSIPTNGYSVDNPYISGRKLTVTERLSIFDMLVEEARESIEFDNSLDGICIKHRRCISPNEYEKCDSEELPFN